MVTVGVNKNENQEEVVNVHYYIQKSLLYNFECCSDQLKDKLCFNCIHNNHLWAVSSQTDSRVAPPLMCGTSSQGAGQNVRGCSHPAHFAPFRSPKAAVECCLDFGPGLWRPRHQRGNPYLGWNQTAPAYSTGVGFWGRCQLTGHPHTISNFIKSDVLWIVILSLKNNMDFPAICSTLYEDCFLSEYKALTFNCMVLLKDFSAFQMY